MSTDEHGCCDCSLSSYDVTLCSFSVNMKIRAVFHKNMKVTFKFYVQKQIL